MKICFFEIEENEGSFFEESLSGHDLVTARDWAEADSDADVLCLYIHTLVTPEMLDHFRHLKLITTRSIGYDHINLEECWARGIVVCNVPGTDANTVAEHTFALILALSRRLSEVCEANKLPKFSYERLRGFDLKDKTLGIVGTGRIGLRVAHIGLAFGMKVTAYEPYRQSLMAEIVGLRYVSFDDLLAGSHVISLHAPLTPETLHMLDRKSFAKMRRGAVVINTARGALIDTEALTEALDQGIIAGVGLDVLEEESVLQKDAIRIISEGIVKRLQSATSEDYDVKHPESITKMQTLINNRKLLARKNVVFTPHVAFNSVEAVERINAMTVENIEAYQRGAPINVIYADSSTGSGTKESQATHRRRKVEQ
jgi:D-lactate dehydrogenase